MAQKSDREGLKKKYVDYLGNLIIDGKIKEDIIKLIEMDLLWENANPESVFNEQTISLDLSQYETIYLISASTYFATNVSFVPYIGNLIYLDNKRFNITYIGANIYSQEKNIKIRQRSLQANKTMIHFYDAYQVSYPNNDMDVINTSLVPYQIYGVK